MPQVMSAPRAERPRETGAKEANASHLMIRLQGGDGAALEQLMRRYRKQLENYASRMLGCADDGEDVAQEVFVRAWEHRYRWKPGGSAESFLYRIAYNLSLLQLRRRKVRSRCDPEIRDRTGKAPTPFDHTITSELKRALQEALGELPKRRREAFRMVRLEGRSLGSVAASMGVSKQTVANHVYMASSQLERNLRPYLM